MEAAPQQQAPHPRARPLFDRVVIRRTKPPERTPGGIIIPDTAKEALAEGVVIATGSGYIQADGTTWPVDVAAGDYILVGKHAGQDVLKALICKEADILGILKDPQGRGVDSFIPINHRVLLKPDKEIDRIGLIWLPNPERPSISTHTGIVVSMGPGMKIRKSKGGRWPLPDGIKIGSRVVYQTEGYSEHKIKLVNGEGKLDDYTVANQWTIIGEVV